VTRFWWVRHGPTHREELIGWTDAEADLSDVAELRRLSGHLPPEAPVISSDLLRCRATADAFLGERALLGHLADLREIHFGDWEGRTPAELAEAEPELSEKFWTSPGDIALPGGESWNELSARVSKRVETLCDCYPDQDVIAVAHLGVILSQIQMATGMPASSALGFQIDNLSVTRIDYLGAGAWRVFGVNHKP